MAKHCGEIKSVSGTTGGGFVAVGNEDSRGNVTVPIGGLVRVATQIPLIEIGQVRLVNYRLCMAEVAPYIRPGDKACIFAFGHLLRQHIIIGVKSESGPSWTMGFGRFVLTVLTYLTLWPFLVGLAGALIGGLPPLIIGANSLSTLGFALGVLYGIGISLLSAVRLVLTYRQMQEPHVH